MNSIRPSIFSSVFADANYNSTLSYSPTKVGWHFDIFWIYKSKSLFRFFSEGVKAASLLVKKC